MSVFQIIDAGYTYRRGGSDVVALDGVTGSIEAGEFVALVGPSGCGKSTLLRLAAGLLAPTRGRLVWQGMSRCPRTAMVFQDAGLFPWLTVRENVALVLEQSPYSAAERSARVDERLVQIGLAALADALPGELSGGQCQRVGIARALVTAPDLLLLDEPFSALDAQTRRLLQEELTRYWATLRPATLYITHDLTEAVRLADRVWVMTGTPGRIVAVHRIDIPRDMRYTAAASAQVAALTETLWEEIRRAPQAESTRRAHRDDGRGDGDG